MNNNRGASSCLALTALNQMFTATGNFTSIGIFKGPVPDLDSLVASLAANNTINATVMSTALGATSDNCLAVQRLPTMTPAYDPAMNVWRVGFSSLTASIPGLATGVPTYAIIRQGSAAGNADTYAGGFANGVLVYNVMLVTVGSDSSDAELRILGGQIVSGQSYRMTDLQVSL